MSFKNGRELGHGTETNPFQECVAAVLAAELDEVEVYQGHNQARYRIAEGVAEEFYREGQDWQSAFAGYLAARELDVDFVAAESKPGPIVSDPRQLIKPA